MKTPTEIAMKIVLTEVEEQAIKFSMIAAKLRKAARAKDTAKLGELSAANMAAIEQLREIADLRNQLYDRLVFGYNDVLAEIEKKGAA